MMQILGQRRMNRYTAVHALFDAFHHHYPPEVQAANRGVRMLWMNADRHNPFQV
jgi:hypothetical protein